MGGGEAKMAKSRNGGVEVKRVLSLIRALALEAFIGVVERAGST